MLRLRPICANLAVDTNDSCYFKHLKVAGLLLPSTGRWCSPTKAWDFLLFLVSAPKPSVGPAGVPPCPNTQFEFHSVLDRMEHILILGKYTKPTTQKVCLKNNQSQNIVTSKFFIKQSINPGSNTKAFPYEAIHLHFIGTIINHICGV